MSSSLHIFAILFIISAVVVPLGIGRYLATRTTKEKPQ